MSKFNRYSFTKKVYPDYIVFLVYRRKLITYSKDLDILNYIKFNNKINLLNKLKINYLILDELDIIDIKTYPDNNYYKYFLLSYLKKIVIKIGSNLVKN